MIIYHIEYDPLTGEIDPSSCYDDVDTSFIDAEDSFFEAIVRSEPNDNF